MCFPFNSVKQLQEEHLSDAFFPFLKPPLSGRLKALQLCLPASKLPGGSLWGGFKPTVWPFHSSNSWKYPASGGAANCGHLPCKKPWLIHGLYLWVTDAALTHSWLAHWSSARMGRSGCGRCLEMAVCPVDVTPEGSDHRDVGALWNSGFGYMSDMQIAGHWSRLFGCCRCINMSHPAVP